MIAQPTDAHRDALTTTFDTAKQIVQDSPDLPDDVRLKWNFRGDYTLDLYFHHAPDRVASFAAAFDAEVSTTPHMTDEAMVMTEANTIVAGVPVHAWSLNDGVVKTEQVAA
ncbi:hypothetical protein [Streptomyces iconiensis]|uniref:Halobacterial output domain-containing protein n=1 Tax=Streptomyces iconiensis TaxID=1384038 RepID=A0ABT6ZTP2_9ACTN|nr:hypothetical protein [Streptomyces iconiensis]MDJ1132435.1 hypothetical protein [Streptomyces iconiensis]